MNSSFAIWCSATVPATTAARLVEEVLAALTALGQSLVDGEWFQSDIGIVYAIAGSTRGPAAARPPRADGSDLAELLQARCALHGLTFSWRLSQRSLSRSRLEDWSIVLQRAPRVGMTPDGFRIVLAGNHELRSLRCDGLVRTDHTPDDPEPEDSICALRAAEDRLRATAFDASPRPPRARGTPRLLRIVAELPNTTAELFEALSAIGWLGLDGWLRPDVGLVVAAPLLVGEYLSESAREDRGIAQQAVSVAGTEREDIVRWLLCHDPGQVVVILSPHDLRVLHWGAASWVAADEFETAGATSRCRDWAPMRPTLVEDLRQRLLQGRLAFAHAVRLPEGIPALLSWNGLSPAESHAMSPDATVDVAALAEAIHGAVQTSLLPAFSTWRSAPADATTWDPVGRTGADSETVPSWVREGRLPAMTQIVAASWCAAVPGLHRTQIEDETLVHNPGMPMALAMDAAGDVCLGLYVSIGKAHVQLGECTISRDGYGWFSGHCAVDGETALQPRVQLMCLTRTSGTFTVAAWHASPVVFPIVPPQPDQCAEIDARLVGVSEKQADHVSLASSVSPPGVRASRLVIDVKASNWTPPGRVLDTGAFLRSAKRSGPQFLWTCSCGTPACDGIYWPVVVLHTDTQVLWVQERPVWATRSALRWCETIAFDRAQYREQGRRILAHIHTELARVPRSAEPLREDGNEPFGWFRFSVEEALAFEID